MAIIKSFAPFQNLSNFQVFENDELPNSEYFRITELNETLSGGKNGFLIEGSEHLKETTEVKIEILDVDGNPIYFEPGDGTPEYYEGNSKLIAVHVYDDTPIGIGKITILGELKTYLGDGDSIEDVPQEWKGVYNVKWERTVQINKNISNETIVRFYKRPSVNIDELVKPIFSKIIPQVTQTGSVVGTPLNPNEGSDLSTWRAGTQYKLTISDDSIWTSSVDESIISIPSLNYFPKIREVLSNTEVLVDTPYTSSKNIVSSFPQQTYTTTFNHTEGQTIGESSVTGSFAKIKITNLKTFVGDVARVKVFRKSKNAIGDFQFVQESKLESIELLRDITTASDTELSYGRLDINNLYNYWVTSSNEHITTIDNTILMASAKVDYDIGVGGVQTLSTTETFNISKDVEYTLNFKTLLSGSIDDTSSIKAYFSGSNYEQTFLNINGSDIYKTRQNVSQNILASDDVSDVHLKFDISGSDWYVSNISLKNAQDTSFSPDEFTIIQDIPRKIASETFDFRFEFYDINNNYIPVDVTATKEFDGGNDFLTSGKLLSFESDRNAFRFISGSVQSPENQVIQFKVGASNLTGSVLFTSAAFDVDGNYLSPSDYSHYPGLLTSITPAGALITVNNFTGSRTDGNKHPYVGSIIYTASLEELEEFETVYRLEDGDNAPQLIVTSNANQFIYEPTTLSPKPGEQNITIRAQRKNLASYSTPITVNSGSNTPPISGSTDNTNGTDTYTINSRYFSASFAENNFDDVTYSFTGSDQFGINFSDEITISKVINFDGVSLVLSNESTSFPAKSTGEVTSNFTESSGSVQMYIGGNQIIHDDAVGGRVQNTFDITSVSGTNVTPTDTSPTNAKYSISAFENSSDEGSLNLNIEYLAGDNATSQSFQKVVSYTKSKNSVPNVEVSVTPSTQAINANSVGSGSVTPSTITVSAKEGGTSRFDSIGNPTYSGGLTGSISTNTISFSSNASTMTSDSGTVTIPVNFTDSEGISDTKNIIANVTRVRNAQPTISVQATPVAQTVAANSSGTMTGDIQDITITLFEGGTEMNYNQNATLANSDYKISSVTHNQGSVSDVTITDSTPNANVIEVSSVASTVTNAILTATISYRDSEGTLGTQTVKFNIAKLSEATAGLIVEAEPQTQTVNSNADFSSVDTPSPVLVHVYEDGTPLPYDSSSPYTHGSFYINNITGGTLTEVEGATSASVQPTTPSSSTSINGFVNVVITDSSGFAVTSRKKNFSVAVSVTGDTGIDAVSVTPSISNQNIVRTNTGTFGAPVNISLSVIQGATTFTYDNSSPYEVSTFYIDNIANCTNNDDGTITPDTPSSITPVTSTYDVTYNDSEGVSKTQSFTHVTTVTLDGNTGPGIVHTGLWEVNRAYQFDNGNSGNPGVARRDSVLYSGTYYAATAQHTSTATGTTGPPGVGSYWESLGTQDLFVAAKIGIFEESYIQETLNIGTNDNGGVSTANITLAGGSDYPYFSLGQTVQGVYGAAGIFIGSYNNSGTNNYRQSLVNSDGSRYLKWDGSNLEIAGSITITGGNAATTTDVGNSVTSGSIAAANAAASASAAQDTADGINANTGSLINPSTYSFGSVLELASASAQTGLNLTSEYLGYYNGTEFASFMGSDGGFYLGGTSGALQWDGSTLAISGEVVITGGATSASLHDATLAAADAQAAADAAQDDVDNIVPGDANPSSYAFGSTNSGTRFALASSTAQEGLNLNSSNLGYHNGTEFQTYMASNGDFFLSGSQGGLTWDASAEQLTVRGDGTFTGTLSGGQVIGGTLSVPTQGNPKFHVDSDGNMTAQDANISGSFNIQSGILGSWVVDTAENEGTLRDVDSRIILNPTSKKISLFNSSNELKAQINADDSLTTPGSGDTYISNYNNNQPGASIAVTSYVSSNASTGATGETTKYSTPDSGNITITTVGEYAISDLYTYSTTIPTWTVQTNPPSVSVSTGSPYGNITPMYPGQTYQSYASPAYTYHYVYLCLQRQVGSTWVDEKDIQLGYAYKRGQQTIGGYYQATGMNNYNWQYQSGYTSNASGYFYPSSTPVTATVEISTTGTYRFIHKSVVQARAGTKYTLNGTSNTSTTTTVQNASQRGNAISGLDESFTLAQPSNFIEMSGGGFQALTNSDQFVKIERTNPGDWSFALLRVDGGKANFRQEDRDDTAIQTEGRTNLAGFNQLGYDWGGSTNIYGRAQNQFYSAPEFRRYSIPSSGGSSTSPAYINPMKGASFTLQPGSSASNQYYALPHRQFGTSTTVPKGARNYQYSTDTYDVEDIPDGTVIYIFNTNHGRNAFIEGTSGRGDDNGWYTLGGGHCVQLIFFKTTLRNGNTIKDYDGGWILVGEEEGNINSW